MSSLSTTRYWRVSSGCKLRDVNRQSIIHDITIGILDTSSTTFPKHWQFSSWYRVQWVVGSVNMLFIMVPYAKHMEIGTIRLVTTWDMSYCAAMSALFHSLSLTHIICISFYRQCESVYILSPTATQVCKLLDSSHFEPAHLVFIYNISSCEPALLSSLTYPFM